MAFYIRIFVTCSARPRPSWIIRVRRQTCARAWGIQRNCWPGVLCEIALRCNSTSWAERYAVGSVKVLRAPRYFVATEVMLQSFIFNFTRGQLFSVFHLLPVFGSSVFKPHLKCNMMEVIFYWFVFVYHCHSVRYLRKAAFKTEQVCHMYFVE